MTPGARESARLEPLLSVAEVAGVLGVAQLTVYRLVRRGELSPIRIGRRTLFEPAAVRALIAARRQPPGAAA